jgi:hypothetical protein
MPKIVEIDTAACLRLAEYIRVSGGVPKDAEDPMPHAFPAKVAINAWWAMVAINQQTTPIVGPALRGTVAGTFLRGWDYLLQKAIHATNADPKMFTRAWLLAVTPEMLREIYLDEKEGDTLSQIDARAELLVDLGKFLKRRKWQSVQEAYNASGGYIMRADGNGLVQILSEARAYQDPVQKKFFYLLAIMRNQGFWNYNDEFRLSTPVNYHEQRGHLRLGTVKILDQGLVAKIKRRDEITEQEDIDIRETVKKAIELIAQLLNATPPMMHYYFWNHFRNCCARDAPHCIRCSEKCTLPSRYRHEQAHGRTCIFVGTCESAGKPIKDMLLEPRLDNTIWQ